VSYCQSSRPYDGSTCDRQPQPRQISRCHAIEYLVHALFIIAPPEVTVKLEVPVFGLTALPSHQIRCGDASAATYFCRLALLNPFPRMACLYAQIANAPIVTRRDYRQSGVQCEPCLFNELSEMAARQARHIAFAVV
jgi:hypothetical protein